MRTSLAAVLLGLVGCASWPRPYTAAELRADSHDRAGEALAHYLSQANADPGVCDPSARVFVIFTRSDFEDFLDGLDDGDVRAAVWHACARKLVRGLSAGNRRAAVEAMARLFVDRLGADDDDREQLGVLTALLRTLDARPPDTRLPGDVEPMLRQTIADGLGARARALAEQFRESLEIEQGSWRGRPVTPDVLATIDDVPTLHRFMQRLPSEEGRAAARARIVELNVHRSTDPWVRAHAAETRERVVRTGRNALDPAVHGIRDASYQANPPGGSVLVEQNVASQNARLLFRRPDDTTVVPSLDLRGSLRFQLDGVQAPVTLCGPAADLDVSPCIDSGQLSIDNPVVRLDADGVLHFTDGLGRDRLLALLHQGHRLTMPVRLGSTPLVQVEWPMFVMAPRSVDFGRGEDLQVTVEEAGERLLVWYAVVGQPPVVVALERNQVASFSITTRGVAGHAGIAGHRGTNGMSGHRGQNASCPSRSGTRGGRGFDGGRGGSGGPGGRGGPGGDVHLRVVCARDECDALVRVARAMVHSVGGPGGPGGPGGAGGSGGAGGAGGSGTSCRDPSSGYSTYLSGGSDGMSGMDGARGLDGPPGQPGPAGQVHVEVVRPEVATGPLP